MFLPVIDPDHLCLALLARAVLDDLSVIIDGIFDNSASGAITDSDSSSSISSPLSSPTSPLSPDSADSKGVDSPSSLGAPAQPLKRPFVDEMQPKQAVVEEEKAKRARKKKRFICDFRLNPDNFELESKEKLGKGNFGEVFKAKMTTESKGEVDVVVKKLKREAGLESLVVEVN